MTDSTAAVVAANPFETFWDDIKAEALKVESELKVVAVNLETAVVADIKQVFAIGIPLALQAIIAEAPKLISGNEKFGNAVTSVTQDLEIKLGPVAVQDVQALVQTTLRGAQQIAAGG